jgi:hypothetical protein
MTYNAEQTACILDYLDRSEFPAVRIVTNVENGKVSFFDFHDGLCAAILFGCGYFGTTLTAGSQRALG